jgi:tRNA 2-thiouridine synthesizing protein C
VPEQTQLLFIHTSAPHGTINAQEGLDALLMGSAFADCTALFLGEGILQLLSEQDTSQIGQKNFSRTFGALADYGVSKIYCSEEHLDKFGLSVSDLVIDVEALGNDEIAEMIANSEAILNF